MSEQRSTEQPASDCGGKGAGQVWDWTEIRRNTVVFEDERIVVLNKPAGISVMGERHETDLVRLAEESGETLHPVHRIDKVTSGLILFAKDIAAHGVLTRQFTKRSVHKTYLALTRTTGLPERGVIDLPLSTGRKNRIRIAAQRDSIVARVDEHDGHWSVPADDVLDGVRTYPSETRLAPLWSTEQHTLLALRPITGRRHQIRVHLAWTGHAIDGDPLFDRTSAEWGARTCLHAWRLAFDMPWRGGARLELDTPPDADFWAVLGDRASEAESGALHDAPTALARLERSA